MLGLELFQEDFMRRALLGILLASLNCAVLGVYVVTRRMAFVSTALTHTILPGVVFAFLQGFSLYWGAIVAAVLTALGIGGISGKRELREDTAIGVVFSFMFALGVLMMSHSGSFRDFNEMLFGSALGVSERDLWLIGGVTGVVFVLLALFHRGLKLSSYDEEYALLCGMSPFAMRLLLLLLVALSTVSCVRLVGALLTTALLVTPAAAALLVTRTLRAAMTLSALIGAASGAGGLWLSACFQRVPTGAAVVMVCSGFFFVIFAGRKLFVFFRRATDGNAAA
ncbi:MAG: metal ABC transporter permease [Puniceicoccales bacterium]|jgi:manganese/iron transport system permease protein|nr:metal ABC transporter permease [Puniceicoccales bacterium]